MPGERLNESDLNTAIGMLQGGMTKREVAAAVGTAQSVISRAWRRYRSLAVSVEVMVMEDNGQQHPHRQISYHAYPKKLILAFIQPAEQPAECHRGASLH